MTFSLPVTGSADYHSIAMHLCESLKTLDAHVVPHGLYAIEESVGESYHFKWKVIWRECFKPILSQAGALSVGEVRRHPDIVSNLVIASQADVVFPEAVETLTMVCLSAIKVRKFGNGFQVDRERDFAKRWEKVGLEIFFARHGSNRSQGERRHWLVLLGFDQHARPFHKQWSRLREKRAWEKHGWDLQSLSWKDPYGRGFFTQAAIWTP